MNKRIYTGLFICTFFVFLLSGCGSSDKAEHNKEQTVSENKPALVSDNEVQVSGTIYAGMAGFEKNGSKRALIICDGKEKTFSVTDTGSRKVVYSDRILYRNTGTANENMIGICDLSSFNTDGTYKIETDSGIVSDEFVIKEGLYKDIMDGPTAGGKDIPAKLGADTIRESFLRITDLLLAYELFYDPIEEEGSDTVPKQISEARAYTDVLKNYINKNGVLTATLNADMGTCYQYAAVMAMFAYEYDPYDKEYAKECTKLSELAYRHTQEQYDGSAAADKRSAEDKRYWAAAQLYKLTGKKEYRQTAEDYQDDPPEGFREDMSGYLGTVAYLTCYNKIDLDIGEKLITALMDDINSAVKAASSNDELISVNTGRADQVDRVFETARLMVLGNYITKNIKYVETCENHIAWLYGRNLSGTDHAYGADSEYHNEPQEFILSGLIDSYIYGSEDENLSPQ